MNYCDSLRNLETLKKLTHLYNGDRVYFIFFSQTEYKIVRLTGLDYDAHDSLLHAHRTMGLPFGLLWQPPLKTDPHFRYGDSNMTYLANLKTGEFTLDDPNAPIDMDEARREFQELARQFK